MSLSPPIRRLSNPHSRQEDLINAYEAEEERIINVLSRKLEQLREEKISLENALEAESESHVNRLSRELTALRLAQQQQQNQQANGASVSPDTRLGLRAFMTAADPTAPSPETLFEAMRRENEQLRNRLVDTERDYIRVKRLNEIYREELIEHRRRLGLSVDNLIGLSSSDPFSQPTHHRASAHSAASSPSSSVLYIPPQQQQQQQQQQQPPQQQQQQQHQSQQPVRQTNGVPIPRSATHVHRHINLSSEVNTPLSHSTSSSDSPFPFSPVTSTNPASYISTTTNMTSPPTSMSLHADPPMMMNQSIGTPFRPLSYPSVPPPSLSSSFGSPSVSYHMSHRDASLSPVEPLSRRNSLARRGSLDRRIAETGNLRGRSGGGASGGVGASATSHSHRGSVERGARIAETGTLVPRSRAGSQSLPSTMEVPDAAEMSDISSVNDDDGDDEGRR